MRLLADENMRADIVISIHPPRYETILATLENFLSSHTIKNIRGKTFVLREQTFLEIE
jgi:hypothetical protein